MVNLPEWFEPLSEIVYIGLILFGAIIAFLFGSGTFVGQNIAGLGLGLAVMGFGWNLLVTTANSSRLTKIQESIDNLGKK